MTGLTKGGNATPFLDAHQTSDATIARSGPQQYLEWLGQVDTHGRKHFPGDAVKTLLDLSLATVLLIIFAPLMLIIAIGIKSTSRGPVLFKQWRHGKFGKNFYIYKFRTMEQDDHTNFVVSQVRKNDPRVTSLGKILRRTSLDELPQLINVIKGDMSLVGPRPHAVYHDFVFSTQIDNYWERYSVKPGITGWAQINGLRGETETICLMRERVDYDRWYVQNRSFFLDLCILLATPMAFVGKRAY